MLETAADDATFAASSADVVAIWNTFDQLPDPGATLVEACRWLRGDRRAAPWFDAYYRKVGLP